MKTIEIYNLAFWKHGRKILGICAVKDFSSRFVSARAETLFLVKPHGYANECLVPKQAIVWAARSCIGVLNDNVEHYLHSLIPSKNVELLSQLLAQFSSYTNTLQCNENRIKPS